ncbi:putative outer-membrane protein; putative secreted protein [Bradyrhizobium sp. ORS 278]|uniref:outer membrane protein n=1 Tax=Bradyrhizobium sp. (strain ORS 278) TaxID=114615 RepID=UPI0001508041|nr:outer membrane beta-barrel protein [Bradyrhizobium sp. ORS 278]CAL77758.1 putative outer-membrane protein; putative secreted protein [Bradyrhizobium sp. ORS 278]
MKKLLVITTALVGIATATSASAADLAARPYTKAPPAIVAINDWSGFYLGINGGYGSSRNCWTLVNGPAEGCHNATGGTVGGQFGYRWQMGQVVFGLEAQGNWADLTGNNVTPVFAPDRNRTKLTAFGLFTGQIGYSFGDTLLYAKGGAAVTDTRYEIFSGVINTVLAATTVHKWGASVGAGVEYAFAPSWSVGFEYDHLFMGNTNVPFQGAVFAQTDRIKQDVDLFTARINYRFGGPVVAKY